MKKNQLLLLLGLGVVLAGMAVIVSRKQTAPYQPTARDGAKLLPALDINAVGMLSIRAGSNSVTLAKQGNLWVVKERGDYPANFAAISDLMRKFWDLKVVRTVQAGPSRLPLLGLAGPEKDSTLLEMKSADGKLMHSILLGTSSQGETRGGSGDRYVMVGNDLKAIRYVADSLADVEPNVMRWLNKDFFKVEKLKSITVVTPVATNNWKVSRVTESADWTLADAKPGETLDASKAGSLTGALSSPSFNDIFPAPVTLDKPTTATLETWDGFTYTVKLAKQTDDNYQLQLAITANFVKERVPGKDEKPEDKAKLDKDFKDNLQKHEEKLKAEQAYTKWTYSVSQWTVDPLLKNRKDLLAEMKSDTPPAAQQPGSPAPQPK